MFISFEHNKYLCKKVGEHTWEYVLTDSEFGTVLGTVAVYNLDVEIGVVVIQEYGRRNLNVAANIVAAFVWQHKKYGQPIQKLIDYNKKYNTLFPQYEKDLQKYLVLL
jgi:hypothetical protein